MFATSVGLIMKGLEKIDKQSKKEVTTTSASTIKGHSKDKSSGFFDKLKSFFDEESVQQ
jgi:hypothetical protein